MEYSSDSSESGKSEDVDNSDTDILDFAEDIMQEISPEKCTDKKRRKQSAKNKDQSTVAPSSSATPHLKKGIISKKKLKLKKADNTKIAQDIINNSKQIADSALDSVKKEHFWETMDDGSNFLAAIFEKEFLVILATNIVKDYAHLYTLHHKGQSPYQEFQISWFQNATKYLAGASSEVLHDMQSLCGEFDWDYKSCLISALHTAISEQCSHFIISCVKPDESKDQSEDPREGGGLATSSSTLATDASEAYLRYKMHG